MPDEELTRREAIEFLDIPVNYFKNYLEKSEEIKGYKKSNRRWYFNKKALSTWKDLKTKRTFDLSLEKYEKCFEFAIKMVYSGLSLHGIRGQRSEVQAADDVILGILGEHAVKTFLENDFNTEIELDEEVHTHYITPQDFNLIKEKGIKREPKLGVGVKGSKMKSGFLVLGANEVEELNRKSDVYIFTRVGLPTDHLFRILRSHSFFGRARMFLETNTGSRKMEKLKTVPVWICGFVYSNELEKVTKIPGQDFSGHRYAKSVADMHNSDKDWKDLIKKL